MAGGTGGRGAGEEQFLATLGIARRDLNLVLTHAGYLVDATEQGEGVVQVRVVRVDGGARKLGDDRFDFGDGRKLRQLHKSNLARDQIRILNHGAAEEQLAAGVVRGQGANRITAKRGILVEQGLLMHVFVESADSFE